MSLEAPGNVPEANKSKCQEIFEVVITKKDKKHTANFFTFEWTDFGHGKETKKVVTKNKWRKTALKENVELEINDDNNYKEMCKKIIESNPKKRNNVIRLLVPSEFLIKYKEFCKGDAIKEENIVSIENSEDKNNRIQRENKLIMSELKKLEYTPDVIVIGGLNQISTIFVKGTKKSGEESCFEYKNDCFKKATSDLASLSGVLPASTPSDMNGNLKTLLGVTEYKNVFWITEDDTMFLKDSNHTFNGIEIAGNALEKDTKVVCDDKDNNCIQKKKFAIRFNNTKDSIIKIKNINKFFYIKSELESIKTSDRPNVVVINKHDGVAEVYIEEKNACDVKSTTCFQYNSKNFTKGSKDLEGVKDTHVTGLITAATTSKAAVLKVNNNGQINASIASLTHPKVYYFTDESIDMSGLTANKEGYYSLIEAALQIACPKTIESTFESDKCKNIEKVMARFYNGEDANKVVNLRISQTAIISHNNFNIPKNITKVINIIPEIIVLDYKSIFYQSKEETCESTNCFTIESNNYTKFDNEINDNTDITELSQQGAIQKAISSMLKKGENENNVFWFSSEPVPNINMTEKGYNISAEALSTLNVGEEVQKFKNVFQFNNSNTYLYKFEGIPNNYLENFSDVQNQIEGAEFDKVFREAGNDCDLKSSSLYSYQIMNPICILIIIFIIILIN